jgi:hypothetical protein
MKDHYDELALVPGVNNLPDLIKPSFLVKPTKEIREICEDYWKFDNICSGFTFFKYKVEEILEKHKITKKILNNIIKEYCMGEYQKKTCMACGCKLFYFHNRTEFNEVFHSYMMAKQLCDGCLNEIIEIKKNACAVDV